jgi:hypothetical protein
MPGLDPGKSFRRKMVYRVKPGDDGWVLRSGEGAVRAHASFKISNSQRQFSSRPVIASASEAIHPDAKEVEYLIP